MKRFFHVLLFCLIPALLFAGVKIKGTIKAADGAAPILAHAHLADLGDFYGQAKISVQAGADGAFELEADSPGFYMLWVSAVDHQITGFPAIFEQDGESIELHVQLKANEYKTEFDEIEILGAWNQFPRNKAGTMQ